MAPLARWWLSPHRAWSLQTVAILSSVLAMVCTAADEPARSDKGSPVFEAARSFAIKTRVQVEDGTAARPAVLRDQPLIRYSDQPIKAFDSTLWLWLDGDRPVAVQKVEAAANRSTGERMWVFCLSSLSDGPAISAQWPFDFEFRATEAGLRFEPLSGVSIPGETSRARRVEVRTIAREFSAEVTFEPVRAGREQLRILPRPLYEYPDGDETPIRGAILGFASNGTNPTVLLVLEVRADPDGVERWHYAAVRMTNAGFVLRRRDQVVLSKDCDPWVPGTKHATLTYFWIPRQEKLEWE